jgi:hypothetical protein
VIGKYQRMRWFCRVRKRRSANRTAAFQAYLDRLVGIGRLADADDDLERLSEALLISLDAFEFNFVP